MLIVAIAIAASQRDSGSTASSNPSSYPSAYGRYGSGSTSSPPNATSTTPSLAFGTPPDLLQSADQNSDDRCATGFRLANDVLVAPARSFGDHYTSCGFAIAVGQTYLASNPDYMSARRISVASPSAKCPDVRSNNPNVQCDGENFWMQCQMEGPHQAMWIACRGGNDAVVYIY